MDLQDILAKLKFYNGENFTLHPNAPATSFSNNQAYVTLIEDTVTKLYNSSPTAKQALIDIAKKGNINFAFASGNPGGLVQHVNNADGTPYSSAYIAIDPSVQISAFNTTGEVFKLPFLVTLGHELSHYADYNRNDPADPQDHNTRNAVWDNPNYDWYGKNLPFEHQMVNELIVAGEITGSVEPLRAGYRSSLPSSVMAAHGLNEGISYTDGKTVDVVRLGDFQPSGPNDTMDITDHKHSFLVFGLTGDDAIRIGITAKAFKDVEPSFVYGGDGADRLFSTGKNYLYGGDGDDVLVAEGPYFSRLFGGDGNDRFRVAAESGASIDVGEGADSIYIDSAGHRGKHQFSVDIQNSSSDDNLYWNGRKITGGVLTAFDYEEYHGDDGSFSTYFLPAVMDDYTNIYTYSDGTLNIRFADDTFLIVSDFENGDLGLNFDMNDFAFDWSGNPADLPRTEFAFNGGEEDFGSMSGLYANQQAVGIAGMYQPQSDMFWFA